MIVIIGENRSFDHVFATYVPERHGESVFNLLSQGIVKLDASKNAIPGPNFEKAHQHAAMDNGPNDAFLLSPPKQNFPKDQLPAPLVGGPKVSYIPNKCGSSPITTCEASLVLAQQSESGLPSEYYQFLLSGGTGQTSQTPDQRITNVSTLPAGPFQLTNSDAMPYDSYSASPVHRFYQMWQQLNCNHSAASRDNPSGCGANLFAWVEVTVGAGANGAAQPSNFSTDYSPTATTTGEGSTALGFYNVQKGDVPYFTSLAQKYAMSDNFHQSVNGAPVPTTSCSAMPTCSTSATPTATPRYRRTARRCSAARPTPASCMRSRIRTRLLAPTTGTPRTATAPAAMAASRRPSRRARCPAAAPTATARIRPSPASSRSWTI
ncbi:hypothetical protein [Bradyrhizobium tropiciagri]|uniref:hypothetical protein n=1 Tax=Bradyrhizobium tropiciagri TaxID=312253 RepID=UPI00192CE9FF|nr:hypothetical protein [Bradyrhizobium tropiciagri]